VIALIMLCLLTIIGSAAIDTSTVETIISGVEKDRQGSFYTAEAGIDHGRGMLRSLFVQRNAAKIAAGGNPDWDFALNGSEPGVSAASATTNAGGAVWINNGSGGSGHTYNVKVWNNSDSGSATDDTDGLIYIGSEATGPAGGDTSIEITLEGSVSEGGSTTGYAAQAGGGSAKSYTSDDFNAITDFSAQL
jgi:hypothetical protein